MFNRRLLLGGAFATAATISAGLNSRPLWAANQAAAQRALVGWSVEIDMLTRFSADA